MSSLHCGRLFSTALTVVVFCLIFSLPAHAERFFSGFLPGNSEQGAFNLSENEDDPVTKKLSLWLHVTETDIPLKYEELMRFVRENPGWPKLYKFRERIEDNIRKSPHAYEIAEWFDGNAPKTANGIQSYVQALTSLGHADKARTALKTFWIEADLDKKETTALADRYKNIFPPAAHADRLDNLLWNQRYQEAEYMLALVSADTRKLAEARIALGRLSSSAQKKIKAVPAALQNNSGLVYSRIKWRRQMDKDADAVELLRHAPEKPPHPDLWWKERHVLARRAIEDGHYALAYSIVLHYEATDAADVSQAEWLLGWLSLRFLASPDDAYRHFENLYQTVTFAISRARAAYWLGRAAEQMNKDPSAKTWYGVSAQFPSTFYGQISHEKLHGAVNANLFLDDQVTPEDQSRFDGLEIAKAVRLLARHGLVRDTDGFFIKLLDAAKTRPDFIMIAKLAREVNHPRFSIEANKQLQQKLGEVMFTEGYPLLPYASAPVPESALIHAIIHRESMFDSTAASPAGALGLMQLMPRTARQISRSLGQRFSPGKLTDNPQYNIELGAAYLRRLLNAYRGSYVLGIAAYNAGPFNVDDWVRKFGDPRKSETDVIDWIEKIPIYETRNYVQRVLESYYMYKLRLSEQPKTVLAPL